MLHLSVDVDDEETQRHLSAMAARAVDFTAAFERARVRLAAANAENFSTGGLPVGGWKPRSRSYAWPIMRRTDRLFVSLSTLSGPGTVITPRFASFGTDVEYAKFHQYGITPGYDRLGRRKGMPSRQVMFEPRGFAKDLADDMAEHVVGLRNRVFS